MSTSTVSTRLPNHAAKSRRPHIDIQDLFDQAQKDCYPELKACSIYDVLKVKGYGDFAYYGVLDICNQLRLYDPYLFDHTSPIDIAQKIKKAFERRGGLDMIETLSIHDAGVLTFSLEGSWIAKRINKMLKDGINTWAPPMYNVKRRGKPGKVLFVLPPITTERFRPKFMIEALERLYLYSGVEVDCGRFDDEAMRMTHTSFTRKGEKIVSNLHQTCFPYPDVGDVFRDLAARCYGVSTQKADMMVFMTPDRRRERGYIERCFIAAGREGWLPNDWKKRETLTCCGFRAFGRKQQSVPSLWNRLFLEELPERLQKLISGTGYDLKEFFHCAFKFACLKSHRLAECIFTYEDIVDEEGYTLLSLLKTQDLVHSLLKNSPGRSFKLDALIGKEHDLGFHIVKFTEMIDVVCGLFAPHILCEYVRDLSMLFTCCYQEVWPSKNMLGLCKATLVVMNRCNQLLGIDSSPNTDVMDFFEQSFFTYGDMFDYYRLTSSFEDPRFIKTKHSRFEIISMYVSAPISQAQKLNVCGSIRVSDKLRFANGSGWVWLEAAANECYVSYFSREWYDAVTMHNGSYIPLGNTSCVHSIPISSSVTVEVLIKGTSEKRDESYILCNRTYTLNLKKFWGRKLNASCGTIKYDDEDADGCIFLAYVAIKHAVDTTMELTFNPFKTVRLSGNIKASYEKDVLGENGFLGEYTAHIFIADPTTRYTICKKPHLLPLHKSAMAIPADGCLKMEAKLKDVDTNQCVVDEEKDITASESSDGVSIWTMRCKIGVFELTVRRS